MGKKDVQVNIVQVKNNYYICSLKSCSMYTRNKTYQLVKVKNDEEKIVLETDSSCVEKALDYFYTIKPKCYGNPKYRISIKNSEPVIENW